MVCSLRTLPTQSLGPTSPVLLRTGKRLFAQGTPARALELVSSQALASGVILNAYGVAGPLKTDHGELRGSR